MAVDRVRTLWAPRAWLVRDGVGRWEERVRLDVAADGTWSAVAAGVDPDYDAFRLDGPVVPGLVDAHSHAFQRAVDVRVVRVEGVELFGDGATARAVRPEDGGGHEVLHRLGKSAAGSGAQRGIGAQAGEGAEQAEGL